MQGSDKHFKKDRRKGINKSFIKLERSLDRRVFENAIATMQKYGVESILSTKVFPKRKDIKLSLISYYESTEEYEKCKYIKDFFEKLELEYANKINSKEENLSL